MHTFVNFQSFAKFAPNKFSKICVYENLTLGNKFARHTIASYVPELSVRCHLKIYVAVKLPIGFV